MYRDNHFIYFILKDLGYTKLQNISTHVSEYYACINGEPKTVLVINGDRKVVRTAAFVNSERESASSRKLYESADEICVILMGTGKTCKIKGKNIINFCPDSAWMRLGKATGKYRDLTYALIHETNKKRYLEKTMYEGEDACVMHQTWPIYLLAILTIYLYFKTWFTTGTYSIDANSVLFSGQSYRLVSYMFVHNSVRHLLGNMLSLVVIGKVLMRKCGWFNFFIVYLCGGVCAGLGSVLCHAYAGVNSSTVGASGAIFAVLGALTADAVISKDNPRNIIIGSILCLITSSGIRVDNICHISGFVFGAVIMAIIVYCQRIAKDKEQIRCLQNLAKGG